MSAFHFISSTQHNRPSSSRASSPLSASLADDFCQDQFATFVNQTSLPSPTLSAFPFIAVSKQETSSSVHATKQDLLSSPSMSASEPGIIPTTLLPKDHRRRHTKRVTPEINQLSAETTWKRIRAEKDREMDFMQRQYRKRTLIHQQMVQLRKRMDALEQEKTTALQSEDYLAGESVQDTLEKTTEKWWELFGTDDVDEQIHAGWQRVMKLVLQESEAAQKVAETSRQVKEERERYYLQVKMDHERKYEAQMRHIHQQRTDMEHQKSETVFDLKMWEQSDTELKNRMEQVLHKTKTKKQELVYKVDEIQNEMNELVLRLADLQKQQDSHRDKITQLDKQMEEAIQPFLPERAHLDKEYRTVEERQRVLESISNEIDQADQELHEQMDRQAQAQERADNALQGLEESIDKAMTRVSESMNEHRQMTAVFAAQVATRDGEVKAKKQAVLEAHRRVVEHMRQVEIARQQVYAAQSAVEEHEEAAHRLEIQIASWQRQKKLAVETGQLGRAAKAAAQTNHLQDALENSQNVLQERQKVAQELMGQLMQHQQTLDELVASCTQIQHEQGLLTVSILKKSRETLETDYEHYPDLLKMLVDMECNDLNVWVDTVNKRSSDEQVNLLPVDDDLMSPR